MSRQEYIKLYRSSWLVGRGWSVGSTTITREKRHKTVSHTHLFRLTEWKKNDSLQILYSILLFFQFFCCLWNAPDSRIFCHRRIVQKSHTMDDDMAWDVPYHSVFSDDVECACNLYVLQVTTTTLCCCSTLMQRCKWMAFHFFVVFNTLHLFPPRWFWCEFSHLVELMLCLFMPWVLKLKVINRIFMRRTKWKIKISNEWNIWLNSCRAIICLFTHNAIIQLSIDYWV